MEKLRLPKFEIPMETNTAPAAGAIYVSWVIENWRQLQHAGRFEELLGEPGRCPVDHRFRLTATVLRK
jgi:hypothetical protein